MARPNWLPEDQYVSYDAIVASWGYRVIAFDTHGSYQGDISVILNDTATGRYGFLMIGYGSCSGCDALQAAEFDTPEDDWSGVETLRTDLHREIQWHNGAFELSNWFINADKGNHWFLNDTQISETIDHYLGLLMAEEMRHENQ